MNKYCLISVRPKHAINILNGKKTRELRTWIPKNYVGLVYVYVTKSYPLLNYIDGKYELMDRKNHTIFHNIGMYEFYNDDIHLNGKVVFRFWFDEYDTLDYDDLFYYQDGDITNKARQKRRDVIKNKLCIDGITMSEYMNGDNAYAWHIKQLEIFDEPKSLSDFDLIKAPQKSVWVYGVNNA